jgi:hypothetical protein
LALLDATKSHALVARELQSVAVRVRDGESVEDALSAIVGIPPDVSDNETPDYSDEPSSSELLAACLKATMACLQVVSEMHKKVDFLARELGYKEDSLVDTG